MEHQAYTLLTGQTAAPTACNCLQSSNQANMSMGQQLGPCRPLALKVTLTAHSLTSISLHKSQDSPLHKACTLCQALHNCAAPFTAAAAAATTINLLRPRALATTCTRYSQLLHAPRTATQGCRSRQGRCALTAAHAAVAPATLSCLCGCCSPRCRCCQRHCCVCPGCCFSCRLRALSHKDQSCVWLVD
jgi:hypothetical protein